MQEFVALLRDRYNKSPAHRAAVVPHMSHQYLTMVVYALMDSDEKGVPPQKEGQRNRSNNKQGKSSKGQQIISTSDNDIEFYIEQQCQVCHTRYDDTMLACPQCTVFNNIAVIPNEQVEILRVYSRRLKKLNHAGHIQVINQKLSHKRLVVKPVDQKGDCAFDSIYISFGRVKEDRNMLVSVS